MLDISIEICQWLKDLARAKNFDSRTVPDHLLEADPEPNGCGQILTIVWEKYCDE